MKIIAIKESNTIYYGSIPKVAEKINVSSITIRRWIKAKEDIKVKNNIEIYLNVEKL